jgi:hypothetical protein
MLTDLVFLPYKGAFFLANLLSASAAVRHFLSLFTCQARAGFSDSGLERQSRASYVPSPWPPTRREWSAKTATSLSAGLPRLGGFGHTTAPYPRCWTYLSTISRVGSCFGGVATRARPGSRYKNDWSDRSPCSGSQ